MMLNANKENNDETTETNGQLSYEDHKRKGRRFYFQFFWCMFLLLTDPTIQFLFTDSREIGYKGE